MIRRHPTCSRRNAADNHPRKGAFILLAVFCLILTIGFVAFSVDMGMISLVRSKMQSCVDAAALAAAMEITHAVESAPPGEADVVAYAKDEAAEKAAEVAQLNGFYVDPTVDVTFGARTYDPVTDEFTIDWSIGSSDPANVVKVTVRKENSDLSQPDGKLRLFFARIFGDDTASLRTNATAFVESRDIVVVHDFSRSMNFDSYFSDETVTTLADAQIIDNLETVWNDLQPVNLGTLAFIPQYFTDTETTDNNTVDVTFRHNVVDVVSDLDYETVKLRFDNGNSETFNVSAAAGSFQGTGRNSDNSITTVWVTWEEEGQGEEVTLSGQDSGGCIPHITVTYSADRKSVYVTSTKDLSNVVLEFDDYSDYKFDSLHQGKTGTFQGIGSHSGDQIRRVWVKSGCNSSGDGPGYGERFSHPDPGASGAEEVTRSFTESESAILQKFGLDGVDYPYPSGSWEDYFDFVQSHSSLEAKGYNDLYGGLTFVQYLLREQSSHSQTPALARTKHYPFHAIKLGHNLLCDFLEDLGFNDYVAMVSYDTYHRVEDYQDESGIPSVDISDKPLCDNYQAVADLMAYKQANHYYPSTNIGGGMREAVEVLDEFRRGGARPNILLMTDGNANITDGDTDLPAGWQSWADGYDGAGTVYDVEHDSPSGSILDARLSLWHEVHDAVEKGYTVHTIAVGADADWKTMQAIAHYAKGEFIYVPGGESTEQLEEDLMAAFHKIAGLVPPAKLIGPE